MVDRKNEEQWKADELKSLAQEKAKTEQRKKIYEEARKREAERVSSIMQKQGAKDRILAELNKTREHEADMRSLQHQLDLENKRDKVCFPYLSKDFCAQASSEPACFSIGLKINGSSSLDQIFDLIQRKQPSSGF